MKKRSRYDSKWYEEGERISDAMDGEYTEMTRDVDKRRDTLINQTLHDLAGKVVELEKEKLKIGNQCLKRHRELVDKLPPKIRQKVYHDDEVDFFDFYGLRGDNETGTIPNDFRRLARNLEVEKDLQRFIDQYTKPQASHFVAIQSGITE